MTGACKAYLADPEANASHLAGCESCRARDRDLATLDRNLEAERIDPEASLAPAIAGALPVAPWEGASYRSWKLAAAVAVVLLAGAALLFTIAGISPLSALGRFLDASIPRLDIGASARSVATLLREAPAGFHVAVGILFVAVNAILVNLLRRAPRGYDATR